MYRLTKNIYLDIYIFKSGKKPQLSNVSVGEFTCHAFSIRNVINFKEVELFLRECCFVKANVVQRPHEIFETCQIIRFILST